MIFPCERLDVRGYAVSLLRGEIQSSIKEALDYLVKLGDAVGSALRSSSTALETIAIEDCGKSRVLLNGSVQQLHHRWYGRWQTRVILLLHEV